MESHINGQTNRLTDRKVGLWSRVAKDKRQMPFGEHFKYAKRWPGPAVRIQNHGNIIGEIPPLRHRPLSYAIANSVAINMLMGKVQKGALMTDQMNGSTTIKVT